jgi:HD superfamily phosphohydrolase YqeK
MNSETPTVPTQNLKIKPDILNSHQRYREAVEQASFGVAKIDLGSEIDPIGDEEHLNAITTLAFVSLIHPEFANDLKARMAMAVNIGATDGVKRKSGEPYCTHPITVASLIAEVFKDLPQDERRIWYLTALLHDAIEEGPLKESLDSSYQTNWDIGEKNTENKPLSAIKRGVDALNKITPKRNLGDSVFYTMEQVIGEFDTCRYPEGFEYALYTRQIVLSNEPAVWAVSLLDKATNVMGRYSGEFVTGDPERVKMEKNFAKYIFLADAIEQRARESGHYKTLEPAIELFRQSINICIKTQNVDTQTIQTIRNDFANVYEESRRTGDKEIKEYVEKVLETPAEKAARKYAPNVPEEVQEAIDNGKPRAHFRQTRAVRFFNIGEGEGGIRELGYFEATREGKDVVNITGPVVLEELPKNGIVAVKYKKDEETVVGKTDFNLWVIVTKEDKDGNTTYYGFYKGKDLDNID